MDQVEKLKRAYARWGETRGASVADWMELLADDVRLRSLADGAAGMEFSAPRGGKAEVEAYFRGIARDWEMLDHTAEEFVVEGDRVAVMGRCAWRHRGTGKAVTSPMAQFWRFRDGKVVEFFEFYDTARAMAATQPEGSRASDAE